MANCLFETYKNYVLPHGNLMFPTSSYIAIAKCVHIHHQTMPLPNWKFVLHFCEKCPRMDLMSPKSDQNNSNVSPTIKFHVYQHIALFTVHVICHLNEKNQCQLCETPTDLIVTEKLYTRKDLVMMES